MRIGGFAVGLKAVLLLLFSVGIAYLLFRGYFAYAALASLIFLYFAYRFLARFHRLNKQVLEFAEAVKYRDFTRRFVVKYEHSDEGKLFSALTKSMKSIKVLV